MWVEKRTADGRGGSKRRREILDVAVKLLAKHGYHGVSMDDIGAAASITGPALYHHFKGGKEQMLADALIPVSERLLAGGRHWASVHSEDPQAALEALVDFHLEVVIDSPEIVILHLHELDRLPEEPRREVRKLQRVYVEEWVGVLCRLRDGLKPEQARVLAHGAFGLMNSTPYLSLGQEVSADETAALLRAAALRALDPG
ncbi:TetR/AcrR family transcriptional regulator [Glycomyces sp. NPDC047369]